MFLNCILQIEGERNWVEKNIRVTMNTVITAIAQVAYCALAQSITAHKVEYNGKTHMYVHNGQSHK